jgi:hypothetical protein
VAHERAAQFVNDTLGFPDETVMEVDYGQNEKDRSLRDLIATDVALYVSDPERGRTRRYAYDRIMQTVKRPLRERYLASLPADQIERARESLDEGPKYDEERGAFSFRTFRILVYRGPNSSYLQHTFDRHVLVDVRSSAGRLPRYVRERANWKMGTVPDGVPTPPHTGTHDFFDDP